MKHADPEFRRPAGLPGTLFAVLCLFANGCASIFFFTKNYHEAATETKSTWLKASDVSSASIRPDGSLKVDFTGWNHSRESKQGTESPYSVVVRTDPGPVAQDGGGSFGQPSSQKGKLQVLQLRRRDVTPAVADAEDSVPVPFHVVDIQDIRPNWADFAERQTGLGVWVCKDVLYFLYLPASDARGVGQPLLAMSHGESVWSNPELLYAYPVAMPVLVVADVVTLPLKAAAVVWFVATWDGRML